MDEKLLSPMEFIEYAKDNGYNSTMFEILSQDGKHICFGKCIDIYYDSLNLRCTLRKAQRSTARTTGKKESLCIRT